MDYLFIVLVVGGIILLSTLQKKKPPRQQNQTRAPHKDKKLESGNKQLIMVNKGGYSTQRLLNSEEIIIYRIIEKIIANKPLHCFSQVSLGEILTHKDRKQYNSTVNSKRVDFCICNRHFHPVAVLEYQGSGHELSNDSGVRDSVKRLACENAGLKFIQVFKGEDWNSKIESEVGGLIIETHS